MRTLSPALVVASGIAGVLLAAAPAQAASFDWDPQPDYTGPEYSQQMWAWTGVNVIARGIMYGTTSDSRSIRKITVCDNDSQSTVFMRVYPRSGGYIDYPDNVSGDCFRRDLGYDISHFRMMVRGELSSALTAPLT
ncbi:hypothetical protein OHA21_19515 [Actinoplanes sp. NBC_00393]|uniref:hypothetical protein n=1 Tax=Actinoplanes sp. NBC_00393 TaxID=2975953 RepID=UPI002E1C768F